jgi:hypothetical protein
LPFFSPHLPDLCKPSKAWNSSPRQSAACRL